jgi:tetratricopeptide (TPR) repeat protein
MNYSKPPHLFFTFLISVLYVSQTFAFTPTSFQLKSAPNKEVRHVQAIRLLEHFLRTEVDSIWSNAKFLHQVSIEENDPTGNTISKWMFGCYLVRKGQIPAGIDFLKTAKYYFVGKGDFEKVCKILNELGIAYFLQGDLISAEEHYRASLNAGEETIDPKLSILAQVNLAKLYIQKKNFDKAEALLIHYLETAKNLKKFEAVANAYGVRADIYIGLNNLPLAATFCEKQWQYALLSNSVQQKVNALTNKGIIAFALNNFPDALTCFLKVLEIRKKEQLPNKMYEAYFNMAGVYLDTDNKLSYLYIDTAQQVAHRYGLFSSEKEALLWKKTMLNVPIDETTISQLNDKIKFLETQNAEDRNHVLLSINEMKHHQKQTVWMSSFYWWLGAIGILTLVPIGYRLSYKR